MSETLTLASLFDVDAEHLGEEALAALRSARGLQELPGLLRFRESEHVWAGASACVARALHGALDLPLDKLLAGAWNTMRALEQYADPAAYPTDQPVLHTLAEHTIRTSHRPEIEILVDGISAGHLTFDVVLEAKIESAVLVIQAGRIVEVRAGTCRFTGQVKYHDAVLAKKSSAEYRFPGAIRFPGGVPISPRVAATAGG